MWQHWSIAPACLLVKEVDSIHQRLVCSCALGSWPDEHSVKIRWYRTVCTPLGYTRGKGRRLPPVLSPHSANRHAGTPVCTTWSRQISYTQLLSFLHFLTLYTRCLSRTSVSRASSRQLESVYVVESQRCAQQILQRRLSRFNEGAAHSFKFWRSPTKSWPAGAIHAVLYRLASTVSLNSC